MYARLQFVTVFLTVTLLTAPVVGCKATNLPIATQQTLAQIDDQQAGLIAQAVEIGTAMAEEQDPGKLADYADQLEALQAEIDELEAQASAAIAEGAADNATALGYFLSGVPVIGPFLAGLPREAAYAGAALLYKRPRKHIWKALKAATPFPGDPDMRLGDALNSLLAAFGANHSSAESEAAAEAGDAKPVPA